MAAGDVLKLIDKDDYQRIFVNAADYANLNKAVQAVSGSNQTILIASTTSLSSNLIVPTSIQLIVTKAGDINLGSYNLTINSQFDAGTYKVFSGTGIVTFSNIQEVYPEWWTNNTTPGTTDMGVALRSSAISLPNGGVIKLSPTTYYASTAVHPNDPGAGYYSILNLRSNTTLKGSGIGASIIKLADGTADQNSMVNNFNIGTLDSNIIIEDITFDGNAINNINNRNLGIAFMRVKDSYLRRVKVQNVRGTAPDGGINEGVHIEIALCSNMFIDSCECIGVSGTTCSGFSIDSSSNVIVSNCLASGMTTGNGFTSNSSMHIQYNNCRSYANGVIGFNTEVGNRISFSNCHSSGKNVDGTILTNVYGFTIYNGGTNITFSNCNASYSQTGFFQNVECSGAKFIGCDASYCVTGYNIPDISSSKMLNCTAYGCSNTQLYVPAFGSNNLNGFLIAPSPASGTTFTNNLPFPVVVTLAGATPPTVTSSFIDNIDVQVIKNEWILQAGSKIKINYNGGASVNWKWYSLQ